jgi:hypothetical protein
MFMIRFKKKTPTVTNPMIIPAMVRVEGTDRSLRSSSWGLMHG